jgi:hypothetical protein
LATHSKCWYCATGLNLVLLYFFLKALGKAFWIGWYLLQAFGVCRLVGACFVPPTQEWKRWIRDATLFGLFAYTIVLPLVDWCRGSSGEVSSSIPPIDCLNSILSKTTLLVDGQEL